MSSEILRTSLSVMAVLLFDSFASVLYTKQEQTARRPQLSAFTISGSFPVLRAVPDRIIMTANIKTLS